MPNREFMVEKLLEWNPHWSRRTVESWKEDQLYAVYRKEAAKTRRLMDLHVKQLSFF